MPSLNDPVWGVLEKANPKSREDIFQALRATKEISNKHYSQLSSFCLVFLGDTTRNMDEEEYKMLIGLFDLVHEKWKTVQDKTFFSYGYLLELFIKDTSAERFIHNLKVLKCPHRRAKYDEKLEAMFPNGEFYKLKAQRCGK